MTETQLREAFEELTAEVRPAPDPMARLMQRSRRKHRVRAASWTTVIAGGVAALLFGPIGLQSLAEHVPGSDPSAQVYAASMLTAWTIRLIEAPTRGKLASDTAFVSKVADELRDWDSGELRGYPLKVLFAEDVGDMRVVVAARRSADQQTGVFAIGPRGATPEELATPDAGQYVLASEPLKPYTSVALVSGVGPQSKHAGVGLAPPGCVVATADWNPQAMTWQNAPGGDYAVWEKSVLERRARVTCEGVVRYEGEQLDPVNLYEAVPKVLSQEVAAASAGVRGSVPVNVAELLLRNTIDATGPPRMLFGGVAPGTDKPVYIAVHPIGGGKWKMQVQMTDMRATYTSTSDIGAGNVVIPIGLDEPNRYLVLAPPEATKVELLDAEGPAIETADLAGGVGTLIGPVLLSHKLRALDALGREVGTGTGSILNGTNLDELRNRISLENWS